MTLKSLFSKKIIVLLTFLIGWTVSSQNVLISQGGTVNVSGGETFYDAGGAAGNDGNTSYTITLMPPSGKSVCVDFTSFSSFESLVIYDGTSTSATNIGSLKGNYGTTYNAAGSPYNTGQPALGGVVQAELKPGIFCANNVTGALTFSFTNSSASQSTGWIGNVSIFTNTTSGCVIDIAATKINICPSENVTLTANGTIGASALDNTFNSGTIGTGWNATPGGVSFVSVLSCQPNNGYNTNKPDNTTFAWMQNVTAPRILESNSFDVSNGGVVSFDYRAASDDNGGNGCEAADDKEGVYVQYSIDNGASWVNMKLMFPSVESNFGASANIGAGTYVYNWNRTTIPIPAAAQTTNTKFRWYQHQSTTGSQDSWGIDDVKIIKNNIVTLTITNLTTNAVLATTTNATTSTVVSPTVTTTYRATITDGTSSCFEDVTINVNGGPATTINYPSTSVLNTVTTTQTVTVTNGPVTGNYTAIPAGLSINAITGAVIPSTSAIGTYTISVPTVCGMATATIEITNSTCSTCANASCVVTSITTTTAALGQTGITTAINNAGDVLGLTPLIPGQSATVCVPVTVVSNSVMLGFKQNFQATAGCGNTAEQVITYQLRPASNCSATPIIPNRLNASNVGSGFNPEWDNIAAGNYILCYTINVTNLSICNPVDLQGLGYYNVVPTVTCQDYQIQLYDDDATSVVHSSSTFACTDSSVYLGPTTDPSVYNSGLPFQNYNITITALTGNLNNLVLNRYDAGTNVLAEALTVTPGQIVQNYYLRPAPGQYYKLDKTNAQSGTYSYTIVDVISGATVASGTWTITAGVESAASITLIPQGTASYSGPGVTNGFDVTGINNYTNDRGIGFFSPTLAGAGTHTITYSWNNGLAAPNNCTLTRTKTVTVTGPMAPSTTNISICSGTTATLTAGAITTGATVKWYDAATGGSLLFTGNPFTTPTLTATTSYWVTQTTGGCESARVKVDVTINPILTPTISCGTSTINSVQFTWPAVAGATSYTATHTINGGASVNDGSITSPFTISGLNPNDAVTITLTPVGGSGTCFGPATLTCTANACPTILTPSADQTLCLGGDPTALSVSTTFTGANAISFVFFTTAQTGSAIYTGGTLLGNATPSAGTASYNPGVLGTAGSLPNIAGTYFIYAIANPIPTGTTCRPFQEIRVVVNSAPAVPIVTTPVATCSANGTATVSNYLAGLTYTSTPTGLTVSSTGVISGFTCGTPYTITATNAATCSATSASFTVQCQLATPLVPIVTTAVATCSQSGSSTITNYNTALTYTFTPSGPTVGTTGLISGMIVGTNYTVIAGNGSCVSASSLVFNISTQFPTPTFTATYTSNICSGSSTDIVLTSSVPGITYEWTATATHLPGYTTQGTGTSVNQVLTTDAVVGTININVIPKLGNCVGAPYSISIFVHENPIINTISFDDNQICSGDTIKVTITGEPNGIVYDWVATPNGVQLNGGITSGTTTNGTIQIGATSTNATAIGTVLFTITPRRTIGGSTCYGPAVTSGIVTVNPIPGTPFSAAANDEICSGNNPTLSVQVTPFIVGNVANWTIVETNGVTVTGAEFGNNANFPLTFPNTILTTTSNIQGFVKIRVTTKLGDCEGGTTEFIVKVNPKAPIGIEDHYVCVNQLGQTTINHLLDTGLGGLGSNYEFEWYTVSSTGITILIPGETGATYAVSAPGQYMALVRDLRYSTECEATKTVTITAVTLAEDIDYAVTEAFSSNATLTVLVNTLGTGHLIYSLNDGPWQDSNIFENLAPGDYEIKVVDTEGCTYLITNAQIIGYPKFFTPNGDGFNETWNVINVKNENKAIINIFDRFGKLIKQLSPTGNGWDGTYNGEMLPSTDYWFTIDYIENNNQKNFKAHFSLKR